MELLEKRCAEVEEGEEEEEVRLEELGGGRGER